MLSTSQICFFTSLPPVSCKSEGAEQSLMLQRKCILSWVEAGFKPISINSINEKIERETYDLTSFKTISNDVRKQWGKPLIPISNFFSAIENETEQPFCFGNSDILLRNLELSARVQNLQPGQFICINRTNVDSLTGFENSELYTKGFDLFAMHPKDLVRLKDNRLILGLPWWDLFVPFVLLKSGLHKIDVGSTKAYHQRHALNWNRRSFVTLGSTCISDLLRIENGLSFLNTKYSYSMNHYDRLIKYMNLISHVPDPIFRFASAGIPSQLSKIARMMLNFIYSFPVAK